jgi:hypothetical protein
MLKTAKKFILAKQLIEFIESMCKISKLLLRKKESTLRPRNTTTKKESVYFAKRLNKFN